MAKKMEMHYKEGCYVLKVVNAPKEQEEFKVSEDTLQFDTAKFYKCVFADIGEYAEVEVVNLVQEDGEETPKDSKVTQIVFEAIEEICKGVSDKLKEDLLKSEAL